MSNLSGQVLEDGGGVDGGSGSNASVRGGPALQMSKKGRKIVLKVEIFDKYDEIMRKVSNSSRHLPVDTSDGELKSGPGGARDGFGLCLARILSCFTSSHCLRSKLRC